MKQLREAQLIMLEILQFVDKICRENEIKYWLDSGTLLGAIRHKGFIPWDDDLDIGMLEDDYQRFIEIFPKYKTDDFFLLSNKTNENYNKEFIKIMSKKHILIENEKQKWPKKIYIDIFPFKQFNNFKEHKCIAVCQTLKKNGLLCLEEKKYLKNILRVFRYLFIRIIPINKIIDYIQKKETMGEKKYIGYDLKIGFSYKIEYEYVFPLKENVFENNNFFIPNNSDKYLEKMYGDYMKLPPEDKRKTHAIKIEINRRRMN